MMMVAGLQYIYSPGGAEQAAAKKRITNALTGMVLLFCVYLILFTVNPKMTVFQAISLQVIQPEPYAEEDDVVSGEVATSLGTVSGSNITGAGVSKIPTELISSIEAAAASLEGTGISLSIASSFRSVERQKALIEQNCQNPAGSATCNPKAGKAPTCILKDLNPAKCPHTTGRALDIWGVQNGRQCVIGDNCLKSGGMAACFSNPCQAAVIRAMKAQSFCSLSTEAWHFEKPKMSTKCN
jgi:D-alanyl-D-alanine dipeptidase